jgi:ParB family chromosome partitioning protein
MTHKSIPISSIHIGQRTRKDMGDISGLAESIRELGLLQPIGITKGNELIFGLRRIEAFKMLGRNDIPTHILDLPSIIRGEQAENEIRKDFTRSERVAIGRAVEEAMGNRQGRRSDKQLPDNYPEVRSGAETRDLAAKQAGFGSNFTYRQAKSVIDNGVPELVEALDREEISSNRAAEIAKLDHATFQFTDNEVGRESFFRLQCKYGDTRIEKGKGFSRWSSILAVNFPKFRTP